MTEDKKSEGRRRVVAHLFSGGADSTLAACLLARSFDEVRLITYTSFSFLAEEMALSRLEKMRARFPDVEFVHLFIPIDAFYREISRRDYFRTLMRYGVLAISPCRACMLAMHWRHLLYCLQNGICHASDGVAAGAEEFVEQNPRILMPMLKGLYARFKIAYENPVYQEGLSTDEELYRLGITEQSQVKRTPEDRQIICSQQILFAMTMRVFLSRHTFTEYEETSRRMLGEGTAYIREQTERYIETQGTGSRAEELLEQSLR